MSTFSLSKLSSWWFSGNNQPVRSLVEIVMPMTMMMTMMMTMRGMMKAIMLRLLRQETEKRTESGLQRRRAGSSYMHLISTQLESEGQN